MYSDERDQKSVYSVSATVLAFSKFDLLKKLIVSLRSQTRKPDEIIVVFQGSDEKIWSWLSVQTDLTLYRQNNAGSAGGFTKCIQLSIDHGHDWTWIIDDDAIPDQQALDYLITSKYIRYRNTGFISSRIVDPNGKTYMSPVPIDANHWYGSVLQDGCVQVSAATWLGLLVSTVAVRECGLPLEDYFLWDEDVEFTQRISQKFKCYCVIGSVIEHHQSKTFDPLNPGDGKKYKYWIRNRSVTIRRSNSNLIRKFFRTASWIYKVTADILGGRAPANAIFCLLHGIFIFRPKVRFYKPSR